VQCIERRPRTVRHDQVHASFGDWEAFYASAGLAGRRSKRIPLSILVFPVTPVSFQDPTWVPSANEVRSESGLEVLAANPIFFDAP
jgi:hypothetical protein